MKVFKFNRGAETLSVHGLLHLATEDRSQASKGKSLRESSSSEEGLIFAHYHSYCRHCQKLPLSWSRPLAEQDKELRENLPSDPRTPLVHSHQPVVHRSAIFRLVNSNDNDALFHCLCLNHRDKSPPHHHHHHHRNHCNILSLSSPSSS